MHYPQVPLGPAFPIMEVNARNNNAPFDTPIYPPNHHTPWGPLGGEIPGSKLFSMRKILGFVTIKEDPADLLPKSVLNAGAPRVCPPFPREFVGFLYKFIG